MENKFKINFLDHVAIRVKDLNIAANWYHKVLGLKKYRLPEWGEFPLFMLSGKSGLALFPADPDDPAIDTKSRNVKIDHFAFNVNRESYEQAKKHYHELGLDYQEQDHHYFDSIYTKDPDGYTVELTTLKVDENLFYGTNPSE